MSVIRLTQTGSDGQYFDSDYDEPCDSSDSEGEHWEYGHRANPWYQTTTDSEYYPPFGTDANQQALSHQSSHFYQGLVQVPPPVPLHQPPTPPYTMMMPPVTQPTQPGSWRPEEHLKYQPPNEMSFSNFGAMEKPIQVDPAPPMLPMMESHMVYQNQNQVNYSNFPPVPPPMYMQLPQQGNGFMGIPASTSIMRNSAAFPGVTTPVCQYGAVKPQGLNESPLCTNRELYPALPYVIFKGTRGEIEERPSLISAQNTHIDLLGYPNSLITPQLQNSSLVNTHSRTFSKGEISSPRLQVIHGPFKSFSVVPGLKTDSKIFNEKWLKGVLELKLNSWLNQKINSNPPSLLLINLREYQLCYDELKSRYAKSVTSFWCESTNPDKFVHEDLGIAAYLLCLWRNDAIKKPRFVDVGCGNGLLVYILNSEGFEGIGVDIRKRKIWNLYSDATRRNLIETAVNPQTHPGFPEADWLIGNHSDELTPWLPILATRSNPHCRVFVIPCCPFSLFQKLDLGKHNFATDATADADCIWQGRYRGYVNYLRKHFKSCGFVSEVDILRIPSTKRLCIIGRTFTSESWKTRLENVTSVMQSESEVIFKPRKTDPGRVLGSLSLDESIQIGARVFSRVLELGSSKEKILTADGRRWNPGVTGGGIRLRYDPKVQEEVGPGVKDGKSRKTKLCWMEANHPDGCPYPPISCRFAHRDEQFGAL